LSERTSQYPVGKFRAPESLSPAERARCIETIASAPAQLREAVLRLTPKQLDTPYREGGWTARQVVHHVPESHMNAYIRFKLALTENNPVIKPYDEAAWARLGDVGVAPVEASLKLLESLHERWVVLMRGLSADDWRKQYIHPEYGEARTLEYTLALYAWHGEHHIAHVRSVSQL
jgi:DinB superfamily